MCWRGGMRSGVTPKLVGWDTKSEKLRRVIYFPEPIAPKIPSPANDQRRLARDLPQ